MLDRQQYDTFEIQFPENELYSSFISELAWREPYFSKTYRIVKRCLDICGALCGLAILALLLPIIAILMLCENPGPLFYTQIRVGRHKRAFHLYKLRSMIVNADAYLQQHPALLEEWRTKGKIQNDPRVTRIGAFLRRTSLDELPQMLNVLHGDMSLVGPRAIQFSEVDTFHELIILRQMVKPGLTGLWQVCGRSMTTYEQRAILDCTYVFECSIWMDLQILVKTLPIVFHGTGAC